MKTVKNSNIR
jgi:hypothetical protein